MIKIEEESILEDLKELEYLSQFLLKPKKFKKERKELKKMIKKVESEGLHSILKEDGDDYV